MSRTTSAPHRAAKRGHRWALTPFLSAFRQRGAGASTFLAKQTRSDLPVCSALGGTRTPNLLIRSPTTNMLRESHGWHVVR
jgi:hypothetical protein